MKQFFSTLLLCLVSVVTVWAQDSTKPDWLVATISDAVQINSNYDSGKDWYLYQYYDHKLSINASAHEKENLALDFDVFIENLDHPGDITSLTSQTDIVNLLEFGNKNNNGNGLTWNFVKDLTKAGWHHHRYMLSTGRGSSFSKDSTVTWFRFCLAHVKTHDAYLIRLKNIRLIDVTGDSITANGGGTSDIVTDYEAATISFTLDKTITSAQNMAVGKSFDPVDVSHHDLSKLYLAFTAAVTPDPEANLNLLSNGVGQIELTSGGKPDLNEATMNITTPNWKSGTNTYYIPLSSATSTGGTIDWSAVNYMRIYLTRVPEFEGSLTLKIDNVKILDFTKRTTLPSFFSDGMLLQQKKPINIWGYASAGKTITVTMSKEGAALSTLTAVPDSTGKWLVSFPAQNASFSKYSFTVKDGDETIQTINDVLVGEVWVAAGQSNMALNVGSTIDREEIYANATNDNIRFFWMPTYPTGTVSPVTPEKDIAGGYWGHGNNATQVAKVSAVAYSMVKTLQQKLNIPVGFFYTPVGGSVIEAWLPREVYDEDVELSNQLMRRGMYYDEDFWVNGSTTITGLYNQKVGPFCGYNVAGVIWYQGESNSTRPELYAGELNHLKTAWEKNLGFEAGEMPFVFTQVCPWKVSLDQPQFLAPLYEAFYDAWKMNEEKRTGMFSLYDMNLVYENPNGSDPIHPTDKTPVGKRFAKAVYNMVYGTEGKEYTAPVPESVTPQGNKVIVKYAHVGDGLKTIGNQGDRVHGFAIAGADGIYANANARIISDDEVEVWNPAVTNPDRVTYAYMTYNTGSTLCNSEDFPAAPFRSDREEGQQYYNPQDWTFCDSTQFWGITYGGTVQMVDSWTASEGTISFETAKKAEGKASLKVSYTAGAKVAPVTTNKTTVGQFASFKTLLVDVANPDSREKTIQLYSDGDQVGDDVTIAAGADFQTVTFDISDITVDDQDLEFRVIDNAEGTVYLDNVLFGTASADEVVTGISNVAPATAVPGEAVYSLSGIRVSHPQKGMYIKGNRKVIIK